MKGDDPYVHLLGNRDCTQFLRAVTAATLIERTPKFEEEASEAGLPLIFLILFPFKIIPRRSFAIRNPLTAGSSSLLVIETTALWRGR